MHVRPFCFALAALLTLSPAAPPLQAREAETLKKINAIEGITEYRLPNGLQVLLFPDPSQPKVTINLTVLVGSRHEGYGEAGMAHLLEHMVFKGTPTHKNIWKLLQGRGAIMNGTTTVDRTNYFETMAANDGNLEFAIKLEADRLVNSYIKREDLVSEMTVVRNEFEAAENSPVQILLQRMLAAAYNWHNYAKSVYGNRADIERVPIEKLQAFYKKYYQPDNCVLVVAGKFDKKNALQYIKKYFGAIPRPKRKLDKTYTEEPAQDGERVVHLRRVGDLGVVGAGYHIPAGAHPEFPAVQVLSHILTNEPSGRLYEALVKGKKASGVFALPFAWHDPGMLLILAAVPGKGSLQEARDAMLQAVEKVAAQGVSAEEVARARRSLLADYAQEASQTTSIAIGLSNWAAQGDWRLYFLNRDRIEKVTAAQVKTVAAKYLQRSNRTVGMYVPSARPERVAVAPMPDLQKLVANYKGRDAIAKGEIFDVRPENIEKRTTRTQLADGLKVALLPKKTRGATVHLELTLRYGNADNLKKLESAAGALPHLMIRGTRKLSHQQLMDELDRNKATLSVSGDVGLAIFSIQTQRKNLPSVLELLCQVLREPALLSDDLEVLRRNTLAGLDQQRSDPQTLASLSVSRRLSPYPKTDIRYVMNIDEGMEAIKAVTIEQVKRVYQDYLGAQHGELAIVGDFDANDTLKTLARALAGWKSSKPYARIASPVRGQVIGGKHTIETPDKENANYQAGLVIPMSDQHPDYVAVMLAHRILGGGAGVASRLGDRLRQKEGLSYYVGSSFSASSIDMRATFTIQAISNPANMAKVEKGIQDEVKRLAQEGVTQDELDREIKSYLQQQKVARASDSTLASALGWTSFTGRTMLWDAEEEKQVRALTPAAVQQAFRKHIDPSKLVIAVAGDFSRKSAAKGGKPATGGSR